MKSFPAQNTTALYNYGTVCGDEVYGGFMNFLKTFFFKRKTHSTRIRCSSFSRSRIKKTNKLGFVFW